jgi:hypothetical protein
MKTIRHKFVTKIPDRLEEGVIYISIKYSTAMHKCFCGCGEEVVTPLSPSRWELTFNGQTVSLYPSIGNWSLPCKSHYWIRNNCVVWARKWSDAKIKLIRAEDSIGREKSYNKDRMNPDSSS